MTAHANSSPVIRNRGKSSLKTPAQWRMLLGEIMKPVAPWNKPFFPILKKK
jgi:hypothetical protein